MKIGLIGHGAWGRNHARVLRELGALGAVYDDDPRALQACPQVVNSMAQILDDVTIAGVVIATPPATHYRIARLALTAGKHVLIEKPMCTTVEDAEDLEALAVQFNRVLMVGHLMMYHGGYALLKQASLGFGVLEYAYSHRLQPGRVQTDISCLWSLAPHDVSMLIGIMGMPQRASCTTGVLRGRVADIITAQFEFAAGARGHMFISWLHPKKHREFGVIGSKDGLVMCQDSVVEPLKVELAEFIACIETGRRSPLGTDAAQGINVVKVLTACDDSIKEDGAWITL